MCSVWVKDRDSLPPLIQLINFLFLGFPLSIIGYVSCRCHDVSVWVSFLVVDSPLNSGHVVFLDKVFNIVLDKRNVLLNGQLFWKCYLPSSAYLRVCCFLCPFYIVPKLFGCPYLFGYSVSKTHFCIAHFFFARMIKGLPQAFIVQFLPADVSGELNG